MAGQWIFSWSNGYVRLARKWKAGDVIELNLPMPVRRVVAAEQVEADRGRVGLQRGPIVYCTESPDNPNQSVLQMAVAPDAKFDAEYDLDTLNGTVVIKSVAGPKTGDSTTVEDKELTAIPYHAWANRGDSKMMVCMQESGKAPTHRSA